MAWAVCRRVLQLGSTQNATVVPAQAVQSGQKGQFVYVVKADKTVEPRIVSVARTIERKVFIDKGCHAGRNSGHRRPDDAVPRRPCEVVAGPQRARPSRSEAEPRQALMNFPASSSSARS